jgi:hypothetical protein
MAGTTNAQQWNPAAINQETDVQYTADPQRTGGASDGTEFASILGNKVYYNLSTYVTALFTAFALKGFTTSDADIAVLTAQCANFLTTADQLPALLAVAYSPTPTFNAALANGFFMPLNGNSAIQNITNMTAGQLIAIYFQQDSTGGRTISFPSYVTGWAQPDPTPGVVSLQLFRVENGTTFLTAAGPMMSSGGALFGGFVSVIGALSAASAVFSGQMKAGSITLAAPGTAGQVLTNVGGVFIPQTATPLFTEGSNGNGTWRKSASGTIEVWGKISVGATGAQFASGIVTFPMAFTSGNPVVQLTIEGLPSPGAHPNDTASATTSGLSETGCTASLQANVPTGGGGANFDDAVTVHFYAKGS